MPNSDNFQTHKFEDPNALFHPDQADQLCQGSCFRITQNGEAKAVLMDIHSFEELQETLALLKLLAMGKKEVKQGRTFTADEVTGSIRKRMRGAKA